MSALANIEAESSLLGGLMFENKSLDAVADLLDPEDFSVPAHSQIFEAIRREVSLGKSANPITLKPYFDGNDLLQQLGGIGYLAGIYANGSLSDCYNLAKHILELSRRRHLHDGLTATAAACSDMEYTTAELVEQADAALVVNEKGGIHQPSGAECFDELLAGFDEDHQGVTCDAIKCLDDLLGPLKPKQLVIAAARPGMGKTAMALSYSLGAALRGHGVMFVSLEMSSHELAGRMAADMAFYHKPIPFSAIRDGKLTQEQRLLIHDARRALSEAPYQVVDAGSLAIGRLNSLVRRHKRRMEAKGQTLELVVVDYLQLLSGDTRGRSNYETVSEVSRGLKALAKEHGVAVLALAQLSREVEKRDGKRPQLSDLRDSGQIEQDADAVLFLVRDEYYVRQEEPDAMHPKRAEWESLLAEVQGKIEFIVAKRRNGTTGTATGQFHGQFQAVRG